MLLSSIILFHHVLYWHGNSSLASAEDLSRNFSVPVGAILPEDNNGANAILKQVSRGHNANVRINDANKPEVQLHVFLQHTKVNNSFLVRQAFCAHVSHRSQSIIGFSDVTTASAVVSFADEFRIPWISPSFSTVSLSSPYLISIHPNLERPLLSLVRKLKWSAFTLLYDSTEVHLPLAKVFNINSSAKVKARNLGGKKDLSPILNDIANNAETHVIIDVYKARALQVLEQVYKMGMLSEQFHYVFTDLALVTEGLSKYEHVISNLTFLSLIDPSTPEFREYNRVLRSSMPNHEASKLKHHGCEKALVYDAFNALGLGLKELAQNDAFYFMWDQNKEALSHVSCNQSPTAPLSIGVDISNAIKGVKFKGVTGNVEFNENGNRVNYTVGIFSLGPKGMRSVGRWMDQNGKGLGVLEFTDDIHELHEPTKELKNRTLTITTIIEEPYVTLKKNWKQFEGNDRYEGFCIDLLQAINSITPIKYRIKIVSDGQYGSKNETKGIWNGMIGELKYQKADMAVAPLTITSEREEAVKFTKPFMSLGISIMIKKPSMVTPHIFNFLEPLSIEIWFCILLSGIAVSVALYFVSILSPYEWHKESLLVDKDEEERDVDSIVEFTIMNSFWFTLGSFVQQGSDLLPKSFSGRIVGAVWWFFTLIIISSYTANLAAFLTMDKMASPISGADDLAKQTAIEYGTLKSGSTVNFFRQSSLPTYKKMWSYMNSQNPSLFVKSNKEGIERVRNSDGKYAFLMESSLNEYMEYRKPCNTLKVGQNIDSKGYGIAFPKGSLFYNSVNLAILTLHEQGELQTLKNYWWYDKSECGPSEHTAPPNTPSLSFNNVVGVFYILFIGKFLALFFALFEYIYKVYKVRKEADKKKIVEKAPSSLHSDNNVKQDVKCLASNLQLPQDSDNRPLFRQHFPENILVL
ncbi:unnamed protein product [Clavelina lepadiformis]|uniref:Glutamate receptor n=1 Tax=Clavelina lepadiformis TaxID=159417 RepID=A0ABP0FV96_CLALP